MPSLLIAGISGTGEVAMAFASNMLMFQNELLRHPEIKASFDMFPSLNDALLKFRDMKEFDVLVAIDTHHSIDAAFCLDHDPLKQFVVGVYPTGVDWDRIKVKMTNTTEDPELVGAKYNVALTKGVDSRGTKYVPVATAGLHILRITREVIDGIMSKHQDIGDALHAPGMLDGVMLDADARFCKLWGGILWASLQCKTSAHVTTVYGPGCVAWRADVR